MKEERPFGKLKEELTAAMHAEFTVSQSTDIKLRAGCVWSSAFFDFEKGKFVINDKDLMARAHSYGITYDDCMKYKDYWASIHKSNRQ